MLFKITEIPKSVSIQKYLTSIHVEEWLKQDLFHWKWWVLICSILILLVIWWILIDKSRVHEICLYAVLATIMFTGVHEYGEELTLWDYPVDIIPIFPPLSSINLLALPLIYSLVYQNFRKKTDFIFVTLIITAIICFIIEPILSLGGFYELLHWKYYFNFIIYALLAIFNRTIVNKINSITDKHRCKIC